MQTEYLIAIDEFCTIHNIQFSFIDSLQQTGLIEITTIKESSYIDSGQVEQLERIIRLYNDLDINLEGIEAIFHLLKRIDNQQQEIIALRNRLRLFEQDV